MKGFRRIYVHFLLPNLVKILGGFEVSSLTQEQIEKIGEIAEEAARRSLLKKVPISGVSDFTVSVSLDAKEVLNVEVDVELTLSPMYKDVGAKKLAGESAKAAFEAIENYLRKIGCQFNISSL